MHIHALFSLFQSTTRALTTVASANISTTALIYKFHSVFLSTHQTVTSRKFQRSQKYFSITLRIVATKRRLHKSQRFTDVRVLWSLEGVRRRLQLRFGFDSTAIRPPFYSHSTEIRPRYDHSTTYVTTVAYLCVCVVCCTAA